MAERLGVDHQQLQQFTTSSTWPVGQVRARLARRAVRAVRPEVWVVDDTGFPKDGTASPQVARQYSSTPGKVGNCQIGVSAHAVSDTVSCPLSWRLFLPESWDGPQGAERRTVCGSQGRAPPAEMAPRAGDARRTLRHGAAARRAGRGHRIRRGRRLPARPGGPLPRLRPPREGRDDRARRERRTAPASLRRPGSATAAALPHPSIRPARARTGRRTPGRTERDLAQGIQIGDELALRPPARPAGRPASQTRRRRHDSPQLADRAVAGGRGGAGRYWISNLPADIPAKDLVRLAKSRWRIEHDYRELKTRLGLDHFEGRSFIG
ncbi:transposase [Streptomyces sp. NRRL B-24484]|uniref:IS701 family transposase n=1 Tax=Streptomyces sp. NRRL B-24484 TaxID=1463833 RepID=UPI000D12D496